MLVRTIVLVLLGWLALLGGPWSVAHGETIRLNASLTSAAEVPANASGGTGMGEFVFDSSTNQLTFTVVYQGLSGPATAAQIHGPAKPQDNAPPAIGFPVPSSPISGTVRLTDVEAATLIAEQFYVNILTLAFPQGEVRGQIVK